MLRINNFKIETLDNPGCNNGNYPIWEGVTEAGEAIGGQTCRCWKGCHGLDQLVETDGSVYLSR